MDVIVCILAIFVALVAFVPIVREQRNICQAIVNAQERITKLEWDMNCEIDRLEKEIAELKKFLE
ncbi:MAG: hypothetical protein IJU03_01010 [Thermoguttaceae bacterium]|nr:hypothetical protein [Thermoguttaceae bacterium]